MSEPVGDRLRASRLDLLDLSLRNPLLNYRGSARRGLDIVDERSAQLFSVLAVERGPLRFHHTRTSPAKGERTETSIFFIDEGAAPGGLVGVGESNPENSLATPYTKEGLAERLLATASDARLTLEEQGANTLFLALGMLRWREVADATQDRLAPLVLLPVRLERKSARSFWQLAMTDEEPGVNLSLVEKLKEFGVKIPPAPELETAEQLEAFFAAAGQAIAEKSGWAVERDRVVLGFFSFGKFLMYRDLDPALWPAGREPGRHPVLSGLLAEGFRDGGAAADAPGMDERRPPGKTMEVMDADGSQAEALAEVAGGRHLVIQGPPGTGKSQTIGNLIAEAVFAGKTVLFVAEKMAALDVVQRRLENIGLGDLCLELHSNKASKKEIAAQIAGTLALGKPLPPEGAELVEGLAAHREKLNRYATAAATPVGATGVTPFQAIGVLERLKTRSGALPKVQVTGLAEWTHPKFREARTLVQDLVPKISDLGVPARHPFDGCGLAELLPGGEEKIDAALREAEAASSASLAAAAEWGRAFGVEPPADAPSLEAWCRMAALALEAPDLRGVPPIGAAWDQAEATQGLAAAAKSGQELARVRASNESRLAPHAWDADVLGARGDLVSDGASFWSRLFSGRYRAARRLVRGLCHPPAPGRMEELVRVADAVLKARQLRGEIDRRAETAGVLVGPRWKGAETSWAEVLALREWAMKFRALTSGKKLPASLGEWVVGAWDRDALRALRAKGEEALAVWKRAWGDVSERLAWIIEGRGELELRPFASGLDQARRWRGELGRLPPYVGYWRLRQAVVALGLRELAAAAHDGALAPVLLPDVLDKAWAERVVDQAFRERPELREFDAILHEQVVQRFRKADAATFATNRARLAERHWSSLPGKVGYGQVGLLRHEGAKKARFLPIRRLLEQAGGALQSVKPIFLMSPLSVAAYLPPGGPTFDLVVFDEASQVKPVDAFGAVLRGRQLVVVGDEKQMPPTSFFETLLSDGRGPVEEDAPSENVTQDLQSILGLCSSRGMASRMLRWHYRSRHDSLIAVSNAQFYDNHLIVFPSPDRRPADEGVLFRHLPGTAYERGASRTNPKEADAVVEAVLEHSKTSPHLTLGVVAFSQPQREAIELRIEQLRRKNPEFDMFVGAAREEPFFVKNLENVQGDERDVILISVGYGRDASGAASMNFGPLNQAGGERRLNVLITRARRKCVVFTNLTADDIDLKRAAGAGVRVLKSFLAFAQKGQLDTPLPAGADHDSDFEAQVHAALSRLGHQVASRVGSGGYRIDLAVADPRTPGRFLLGIECDGAAYHDAKWARDRDRLRESVLRGLGWTIHRIWSADWFRNREEAIRRCAAAIEQAKAVRPASAERPRDPTLRRDKDAPPPGPPAPLPYVPAKARAKIGDTHLADVDAAALARFLADIVEREGPVHKEELGRRVLEAIDQRAGSKKLAAIDEALGLAVSRGLVRSRGDFLWPKDEREVLPRDRSALPEASRAIEMVSDEECRAALRRVVEEARGCDAEEAAVQAIKLLGVKRNDAATTRLGGLLGGMVAEGALARSASGSFTPSRP